MKHLRLYLLAAAGTLALLATACFVAATLAVYPMHTTALGTHPAGLLSDAAVYLAGGAVVAFLTGLVMVQPRHRPDRLPRRQAE